MHLQGWWLQQLNSLSSTDARPYLRCRVVHVSVTALWFADFLCSQIQRSLLLNALYGVAKRCKGLLPSGVMLEKPFKLVAMHIQGGGQLDRNFSFGVSVKHIEFVRAYLVMVLPHLQKNLQAIYDIDPEAMCTLRSYLEAMDPSVQKLQMRSTVDAFWLAVKVCCKLLLQQQVVHM